MQDNIITDFPVSLYGNLEKYNETISKGRCRIFYKGPNRNGTYITDEFAEKLLSSISYAPVKGIYESEEGDYTDHGKARSQGRIYGVVPENPNVTWEAHLDEDGVERLYACVDVLIFTALYTEANTILGKSESMEIYPPSIKGEWKIINGKKYYVFTEGHFLGLQVLGDLTEPCFEGAAFFALYQDLKNIVTQIEKYNLNLHNGGKKMLNYKLSDNAKFNALWSLLNTNYCEESGWLIEYDICEIYDEYAVVRNYSEGIFERIYYTKNDENDSVEINSRTRCYILDVSEAEKNALDALHGLNNGTYEKVDENYSQTLVEIDAKTEELNNLTATYNLDKENFETKIGELEDSVATLTTERDNATSSLNEAQNTVASLTAEVATLNSFKAEIELKEKQAVIAKYEKLLEAETIATYSSKLNEYSDVKALDKDLAYELVLNNQSVFSNNSQPQNAYVPKDEPVGGLEGILSKYRK